MKNTFNVLFRIAESLFFFSILLLIAITLWKSNSIPPVIEGKSLGYPAPALTSTVSMATEVLMDKYSTSLPYSYPPPEMTITPNATKQNDAKNVRKTLSPTDQSIVATDIFMKNKASKKSLLPSPTPFTFPISSISDLHKVIDQPSFYGKDSKEYKDCLKMKESGSPLLVHALNDYGDYYIVPFYKENKVCGRVLVRVQNGLGVLIGWTDSYDTVYPQISADEAAKKVEEETGKKAGKEIGLVFQSFREFTDPFNPFWRVITTDGSVYFVSFITGPQEDGSIVTTVKVWKAEELHVIK